MKASNGIIGSPKINLLKMCQQADNVCNSKENLEKPLVTIVITTYNSEVTIEDVLNALLLQDYPLKFLEVIVVDGCSIDRTVDRVKEFLERYHDKFYDFKLIVHDKNYGVSKARNDGIRLARGEYIMILDSDVVLPSNAINTMVSFLESNPKVGFCRPLLLYDSTDIVMRWLYDINVGRIQMLLSCADATLIRREALEKAGLYDEAMGPPFSVDEDLELGARIWKAGYQGVMLGNVIARHLKVTGDAHLNKLIGKRKANKMTLVTYGRWLIGYFRKPHRVAWYKFLKSLPLKLKFNFIFSSLFLPFTATLFLGLLIPLPHYINILALAYMILAYLNTLRDFTSKPRHIHKSIFLALLACINRSVRTLAALYAIIELKLTRVGKS